jgi:hypothetical protein
MRFCLILMFAGLLSLESTAQRFQGNASLGINLAQLDGDDLAGFNQPGLVGGIGSSYLLSESWQLGIEILASQQGAAMSSSDPLSAAYKRIRLNVVELPIQIQYTTWNFQFGAGLSYSAAINQRIVDFSGLDISNNFTVERSSINFLVGGTYYFNPTFGVDVRYTSGILPRDLLSSVTGAQVDQFLSYFLSVRGIYLFN